MLDYSNSTLNEFTFRLGCVEKHWNAKGKEIVEDSMINLIAEEHRSVCGLEPNIFGCPNMYVVLLSPEHTVAPIMPFNAL